MTTSTIVKIRPATAEDADAIAIVGADVFTKTFGHSVTQEQLEQFIIENYSPGSIAKDLANPNKDFIVALDGNDAVVAFALLSRGSNEPCTSHLENLVQLQKLYVGIDQHGKGIGKSLASEIHDMARKQGFKHIWLGVWEENHKAMKIYERLGYQYVGERIFDVSGDLQRDKIMYRAL